MIPTAIFISDGQNKELQELSYCLQYLCRVIYRTDFQGEQLYKIFEGVIFKDTKDQVQFIRQDEYDDVIKAVVFNLEKLDAKNKEKLKKYLQTSKKELSLQRCSFKKFSSHEKALALIDELFEFEGGEDWVNNL